MHDDSPPMSILPMLMPPILMLPALLDGILADADDVPPMSMMNGDPDRCQARRGVRRPDETSVDRIFPEVTVELLRLPREQMV